MNNKKIDIHIIAALALMAALVFVVSCIEFPISTGIDRTRIHLGNAMCLLAALLFGKTKGGLAAGIGSVIYDFLIYPDYISTSWATFIMKFTMAFVCGLIVYTKKHKSGAKLPALRSIIGTACGAFSYIVLYLTKNYIENYLIIGKELEVVLAAMVTKGVTSLINAAIAIPTALLLATALRPALRKSGLGDKIGLL